jgi:hypothetical protein
MKVTELLGVVGALGILLACSGSQDLGQSGKSKAGETCSKTGDCADNLKCIDQRCGDGGGVTVSPVRLSCPSDATCALRGASTPFCKQGGACVECMTDAHCAANGYRPRCKLTPSDQDQNLCVECLTDPDCTDPTQPRCSAGTYGNFCMACLADADCKDPTRPHCKITQSVPGDAPFGSCWP